MTYTPFFRGIELLHPALTRDWRLWFGYFCWWFRINVTSQGPPPWWKIVPASIFRRMMYWGNPGGWHESSPWGRWCSWWATVKRRLVSWTDRHVKGFSCRSDWTDRDFGILYGGAGWSEAAFASFLEAIGPDPAIPKMAVAEFRDCLSGRDSSGHVN